jgi:hypothetical protein
VRQEIYLLIMEDDNIEDLGLTAKEQDQITSTAVAFEGLFFL